MPAQRAPPVDAVVATVATTCVDDPRPAWSGEERGGRLVPSLFRPLNRRGRRCSARQGGLHPMERAIVEVDRLDVGERAPKATLTGFPKVEFLGISNLVLRIGVGAVVVGGGSSWSVPSRECGREGRSIVPLKMP